VDCSIFVVDGFGLVADCLGLVVDGLGLLKMVQAWLLMVWVGCRLFGLDVDGSCWLMMVQA
jgi:hypothetical protein